MIAWLFALGAQAADEEPPPSVAVPQARAEWHQERATEALDRFFEHGDTRLLRHAVAIDPTTAARVHLSIETHEERRTVVIDGVVQSHDGGATVVRTIRTTDERGRVTVFVQR